MARLRLVRGEISSPLHSNSFSFFSDNILLRRCPSGEILFELCRRFWDIGDKMHLSGVYHEGVSWGVDSHHKKLDVGECTVHCYVLYTYLRSL